MLKNLSALLFFGAVLFSPATLILLHTPRYVLALAFFFRYFVSREKALPTMSMVGCFVDIVTHRWRPCFSRIFRNVYDDSSFSGDSCHHFIDSFLRYIGWCF